MNGWTDGWMDERMEDDKQIDRYLHIYCVTLYCANEMQYLLTN